MDNDDLPVGRILSRREVLALFGAAGASFLVACTITDNEVGSTSSPSAESSATSTLVPATTPTATVTATPVEESSTSTATTEPTATIATEGATEASSNPELAAIPACVVSPEMTEGPYFVDELLNRSDVRSDPATGEVRDGALLEMVLRVSVISAGSCTAFSGAMVDIWQCDAEGVYSDAVDRSFDTSGQQFLRGYQVTDGEGIVRFTTIYPGWYDGRAVHIHFKIRTMDGGQEYEFTSQFFFDDEFTDQVYLEAPYSARGPRTVRNSNDGIYNGGGDQLTLTTVATGDGYLATFDIGVQTG